MKRLLPAYAPLVFAVALAASPQTALAEAVTYSVDTVHSSVIFKVRHMDIANAYGRFNDVTGKVVVDSEDPSKGSIEMTVKSDSVDSANEKRDQHLKGPDFLNAKEFPEITLKSKKISKVDDTTFAVDADLTLRGTTKPVSFKVKRTGSGKHPRSGKELLGGEGEFTFKRSDFGINYMPSGLGDEITIIVSLELIRQ